MYDCNSPLTPEQQGLVTQHYPLALWVVKSRFGGVSGYDCRESLKNAAIDGLLKAAQKYRPDWISPKTQQPVQFQTYATRLIWQACYNALTEFKRDQERNREESIGKRDFIDPRWRQPQVEIDEEHELLTQKLNRLPRRDREILYATVGNNESMASVGRQIGLSRERVRQVTRRAERRLQEVYSS